MRKTLKMNKKNGLLSRGWHSLFYLLLFLLIFFEITENTYGWDSQNPESAHYFIIQKAITHLRNKDMLAGWPLESYLTDLNHGAKFADYPFEPYGITCDWTVAQSTCDAIHHFYSTDCIIWKGYTDPNDFLKPQPEIDVCVAFTGGLAVPEYAQTLYDLASLFWPGGPPAPEIHYLKYLGTGGSMTTVLDSMSLGPFVVGALPFAALTRAQREGLTEIIPIEYAYTWPGWTDGSESIKAALTYLGWAIHLIEDVATPVHANNETGGYHKYYEQYADELIKQGLMEHLPVIPEKTYHFPYDSSGTCFYETRPDFFHDEWSLSQFADETVCFAREATEPSLPPEDILYNFDAEIEANLDIAIKAVAGIIKKFFSSFELSKDFAEPNDSADHAWPLVAGRYDELTLHAPLDEDYYSFLVSEHYSDVKIIVSPSPGELLGDLTFYVEYKVGEGSEWQWLKKWPRYTDGGLLFEEKTVLAGRIFRIHVYTLGDMPQRYSLFVSTSSGNLPPDRYEPNDTQSGIVAPLSTAATFGAGCDFTSTISIHNASDIDWYKIEALGYSVEAQIFWDPRFGELSLTLDGTAATEEVNTETSPRSLRIRGCGRSPSYVKVQGAKTFYNICITRMPLEPDCTGYPDSTPMKGSGTFTYVDQICSPGEHPEQTVSTRPDMYAVRGEVSGQTVTWSVASWLQYTYGVSCPLVVELVCPKPGYSGPTVTRMKVLKPTLDGVLWTGSGQGQCESPDITSSLYGFQATAEMTSILYPYCVEAGHGTLTVGAVADSDGDGLSDLLEEQVGTNPKSDDTDNDGLDDGREDANRNGIVDADETDPRKFDSDEDGLSDGVERGLTSSLALNTNLTLFQEDLDPSTTTNPSNKDTDRDGISDGSEDVNHNGRQDPGETSPCIADNFVDLALDVNTSAVQVKRSSENLTYTLIIRNRSTFKATGVGIWQWWLPGSIKILSKVSSQGQCRALFSPAFCSLGQIPAGGSVEVTFVVSPRKLGELISNIRVQGREPDPDLSNNSKKIVTQVQY